MHIIYLTTALRESDYAQLLQISRYAPNPSNQNFHLNLIEGLGEITKVDVISARPFHYSTQKVAYYPAATIDNFHYLGFFNLPLLKPISVVRHGAKIVLSLLQEDSIIVVDSLNLTLAYLVNTLKKKTSTPIFALVTDLAENMSSVKPSYVKKMAKTYDLYDGFLCLTEGLNQKVNQKNKPSMIFHGLIRNDNIEADIDLNQYGKYFFFAGALYRRYGIIALLERRRRGERGDVGVT
ncbi:MAG: hypothetical protein EOM74_04995, partial [Methanomicrobia archaeon]|nr:hypothetical protein [Methanomicrobia archaeon]